MFYDNIKNKHLFSFILKILSIHDLVFPLPNLHLGLRILVKLWRYMGRSLGRSYESKVGVEKENRRKGKHSLFEQHHCSADAVHPTPERESPGRHHRHPDPVA